MTRFIKRQASGLRHPPLTVAEVLAKLEIHAPEFARLIREHAEEE